MLRNLILLLLVVVAGFGLAWWGQTPRLPEPAPVPAAASVRGPQAPDFTFTNLDGETIKLSDLRGKVVLLNFWASWCAPCIVEFPQMIDLAKRFDGRLVFLAVSVDHDEAAMKSFLAKQRYGAETLIAWDKEKKIAHDLFQSIRYPETIIIAPNGVMVEKVVGLTDWLAPAMISKLERLTKSQ